MLSNAKGNSGQAQHDGRAILIRSLLWAGVIEVITVGVILLTLGHAGPEGPFAEVGWIGVLLNLPSIFIVGWLFSAWNLPLYFSATLVFIFQTLLLTYIFFLYQRRRKFRSKARS
jgi:hypothetical protein